MRLQKTKPNVAALKHFVKRYFFGTARFVLAVQLKGVQHAARPVNESHVLDAADVADLVGLLAEQLDSAALFAFG